MATKLLFHAAAADYGTGDNNTKLNGAAPSVGWRNRVLNITQGSSVATVGFSGVAGPTSGIECAGSTGTAEVDVWYSAPLDADITISGSITWNLRGSETAMANNMAINGQLEVIDGATGTITLIDKTARTIELGTSESANNFAETPASGVACKRGDRLRVRVFVDDSVDGNMAASSGTFFFDGAAGATGDSYLTLTENLTFVSEPAGTTIYPTDTASAVSTASVDREAWSSRGAGVQTDATNTAAGYTSPIQITDTAGGTVVDWFTKQLTAFTLGGAVRVNARMGISGSSFGCVRCEVARVAADGTSATVWGAASNAIFNGYGSTEAARSFLVGGDDLAISDGQRLRIRFYVDDSSRALVTGQTATLYYAGTSGGASGDTYLTFTQTLTESSSGTSANAITATATGAAPGGTDAIVATPVTSMATGTANNPTARPGIATITDAAAATGAAYGNPGTTAADDFSDAQTNTWASADTGGSWTLNGTAANWDKAGGVGTIVVPSFGAYIARLASTSAADAIGYVRGQYAGADPTYADLFVMLRVQDALSWYCGGIRFDTDGNIYALITVRDDPAAESILTSSASLGAYNAAEDWSVRFEAIGTTLRVKAWKSSGAEPGSWTISTTDSTWATGQVGLRFPNNSGASVTWSVDDFIVTPSATVANIKVNAGIAAGTGAALAADMLPSQQVTAQVATATGAALNATVTTAVSTSATAQVATATGAAANVSASIATELDAATATGVAMPTIGNVTANLGAATGTGAAADADLFPSQVFTANVATATGQAYDATATGAGAATSANAEAASATGTASAAAPSIAPDADLVTATGTAITATAHETQPANLQAAAGTGEALGTDAKIGATSVVAAATGAGLSPDAAIKVNAGVATGTGAALVADGLPGTRALANVATSTGAANVADGLPGELAPAEVAATAGTAQNGTTKIAPTLQVAAATGAANNATVSVASTGQVTGQTAEGTGAAQGTDAAIAPRTVIAAATGAAANPSVHTAISRTAGVAAATGTAGDIDAKVTVNAGSAAATGTAANATVTTTAAVSATAQVATAQGAAHAASVGAASSISANAATATATGTAYNARVVVAAVAQAATGTGNVHAAAIAVAVAAYAETATATGTAYDAGVALGAVAALAEAAVATGTAYNARAQTAVGSGIDTTGGIHGGIVSLPAIRAGVAAVPGVRGGIAVEPGVRGGIVTEPRIRGRVA